MSVVQDPLSPLLRRPTPCSRSPPRCGTADWLASSLVSCEPARPATRFSVWASTAWIWLRRRFLARAEVGHPGAKDAGSAVATEADRVSVLPHSARQFLRRGFRPGPFLLPESKPQATRS